MVPMDVVVVVVHAGHEEVQLRIRQVVLRLHLLTVLLHQPTKPLGSKGKELNCVKDSKFCSGYCSSETYFSVLLIIQFCPNFSILSNFVKHFNFVQVSILSDFSIFD